MADSKEYAMSAILKGVDSMKSYRNDIFWGVKVTNLLYSYQNIRLQFEN